MITDIRSILNLFEALEEFEYPVPDLSASKEYDAEFYVQYTKEGVILKGEGLVDDNFFSDEDGGEEHGAMDFKINLTTGKIDLDPEDYSGERYIYPDEDRMEEVVREIAEEFNSKYGKEWGNIYKRLHKGARASAQKPTFRDEQNAKQAEFKKQANRLYPIAPKIFHSVFVRMKRAGATKEQLAYLREVERDMTEIKWRSIARHAVNENGHSEEDWFARTNYTTADLTELIDQIIKYMTELLMSNIAWQINSMYSGF